VESNSDTDVQVAPLTRSRRIRRIESSDDEDGMSTTNHVTSNDTQATTPLATIADTNSQAPCDDEPLSVSAKHSETSRQPPAAEQQLPDTTHSEFTMTSGNEEPGVQIQDTDVDDVAYRRSRRQRPQATRRQDADSDGEQGCAYSDCEDAMGSEDMVNCSGPACNIKVCHFSNSSYLTS
jgi:hypothetical protein